MNCCYIMMYVLLQNFQISDTCQTSSLGKRNTSKTLMACTLRYEHPPYNSYQGLPTYNHILGETLWTDHCHYYWTMTPTCSSPERCQPVHFLFFSCQLLTSTHCLQGYFRCTATGHIVLCYKIEIKSIEATWLKTEKENQMHSSRISLQNDTVDSCWASLCPRLNLLIMFLLLFMGACSVH